MACANKKKSLVGNDKLTDKELIKNLINNDDSSVYEVLWSRYKEPINYLLLKMTRNKLDAEELTSEAICRAFLNINKYNFKYCFSTWLYSIATNAAIDFIRKKKLKTESINKFSKGDEGEEYELPIKDSNPDPLEKVIRNEVVGIINNAIDDLDDNSANLVRSKHLIGKTYVEIAKEKNVPIGTIKTHIFRAIKKIEERLKEQKGLLF